MRWRTCSAFFRSKRSWRMERDSGGRVPSQPGLARESHHNVGGDCCREPCRLRWRRRWPGACCPCQPDGICRASVPGSFGGEARRCGAPSRGRKLSHSSLFLPPSGLHPILMCSAPRVQCARPPPKGKGEEADRKKSIAPAVRWNLDGCVTAESSFREFTSRSGSALSAKIKGGAGDREGGRRKYRGPSHELSPVARAQNRAQ